jgi:hypothetical protein
MITVEFKDAPTIGDDVVVRAEIAPLLFAKFCELARKVNNERVGNQKYETLMQRERILSQVTFIANSNKKIRLTQEQLFALPASVAKAIIPALSKDEGLVGKIITTGDGISTPILYRFGTPIKGAGGKDIEEVEFLASTYGDLEDVLSGSSEIYQALDLLTLVAKPVGGSLSALPSWAIDQITLADGVFVSSNILPRFLE